MKNAFFLTIALLCLQATLQAQMTAGVKIGMNQSIWRVNETVGKVQFVNGVYFGIPIYVKLSERWHLLTGAGIIQKGSKLDISEEIGGGPLKAWAKTRVTYGELPITVQYNFQTDQGFFFRAGISLSHAFSGTIKAHASDGKETVTETQDLQFKETGFRRFDVNAVLAAGYMLPVATGKIALESTLRFGLKDISSDPVEKLFNNGALIAVAYYHNL